MTDLLLRKTSFVLPHYDIPHLLHVSISIGLLAFYIQDISYPFIESTRDFRGVLPDASMKSLEQAGEKRGLTYRQRDDGNVVDAHADCGTGWILRSGSAGGSHPFVPSTRGPVGWLSSWRKMAQHKQYV